MKLSTIAFRNISRNRRRSLLSITAIAVAALSITGLFSLVEGMRIELATNIQSYSTGEVRIRHADVDRFEILNPVHLTVENATEVMTILDGVEGVAATVPRVEFPGAIFLDDDTVRAVGVGIDLERERALHDIDARLVSGRFAEPGRNEAVVGTRLARELGLGIGERFTILTTTALRGSNAMTFEIVGIIDLPVPALAATWFLVPIDRAQHLMRMSDQVSSVLTRLEAGSLAGTLAGSPTAGATAVATAAEAALHAAGHETLSARAWNEISDTYSLIETFTIVYDIIALFFFVLGSSVVINTTMMVVYERTREIGTLSAMGMGGGRLIKLFFLEGLYLSVAGAALGVALGVVLSLVLGVTGINMGDAISIEMEIGTVIYPVVNLRSTVVVFLYSVAVASIAAVLPARKAARISPVEALRAV